MSLDDLIVDLRNRLRHRDKEIEALKRKIEVLEEVTRPRDPEPDIIYVPKDSQPTTELVAEDEKLHELVEDLQKKLHRRENQILELTDSVNRLESQVKSLQEEKKHLSRAPGQEENPLTPLVTELQSKIKRRENFIDRLHAELDEAKSKILELEKWVAYYQQKLANFTGQLTH